MSYKTAVLNYTLARNTPYTVPIDPLSNARIALIYGTANTNNGPTFQGTPQYGGKDMTRVHFREASSPVQAYHEVWTYTGADIVYLASQFTFTSYQWHDNAGGVTCMLFGSDHPDCDYTPLTDGANDNNLPFDLAIDTGDSYGYGVMFGRGSSRSGVVHENTHALIDNLDQVTTLLETTRTRRSRTFGWDGEFSFGSYLAGYITPVTGLGEGGSSADTNLDCYQES